MQDLIKRYSATDKPITLATALHSNSEFPPLPNYYQRTQDHMQKEIVEEILNVLSSIVENIIEEITNRFRRIRRKAKSPDTSRTNKNEASKESLF